MERWQYPRYPRHETCKEQNTNTWRKKSSLHSQTTRPCSPRGQLWRRHGTGGGRAVRRRRSRPETRSSADWGRRALGSWLRALLFPYFPQRPLPDAWEDTHTQVMGTDRDKHRANAKDTLSGVPLARAGLSFDPSLGRLEWGGHTRLAFPCCNKPDPWGHCDFSSQTIPLLFGKESTGQINSIYLQTPLKKTPF